MRQVREAFDIINKCRRLPVMLEVFLGQICGSVLLSIAI